MSMGARLQPSEHSDLPWRINDFVGDFELIDAWALPASGTREEFADLCEIIALLDPGDDRGSAASRKLSAVRAWLGGRMGWDAREVVNQLPIPGCTESSLSDRLPPDLAATGGRTSEHSNFRAVFEVDDEAAFEVSNSLVHAILHLGWAHQPGGTFRAQMGVYVKHRGPVGTLYMTAIAPFRHRVIYPALLRRIGAAWATRTTLSMRTSQANSSETRT